MTDRKPKANPWPNAELLPGEEQAARRIPLALPASREEEILRRNREWFLSLHLEPLEAPPPWRRPWMLGAVGSAACALLVLLWLPKTPEAPKPVALQMKGFKSPTSTQRQLEVKAGATGELAVPKLWRVKASATTQLTVVRGDHKRQKLQLRRGLLQIHVVPRKMKSFVVDMDGVRVEVKGTRFSVERTATWIRVEVWKGAVEVYSSGALGRSVKRGQGCRIGLPKGASSCYRLPPAHLRKPAQRIPWLGEYERGQLASYLADLALHPRLSQKRRSGILNRALAHFQRSSHTQGIRESYLALALISAVDSDQAHVEAGKACLHGAKGSARSSCLPLFRRCLKRCQMSFWREQSHGSLAKWSAVLARTPKRQRQALHLISRYLRDYPKGSWRKGLRSYGLKLARGLGLSCNEMRAFVRRGEPGYTWFQKRCGE